MAGKFRFTFGPWNIHEGADPFGPMVRNSIEFGKKLDMYKKLGFDGVYPTTLHAGNMLLKGVKALLI